MNNDNSLEQYDDKPILSVVQKIKLGQIDPKTLPKDFRQRCVEVFWGEGYSVSQIAQILNRSEKTIRRDMQEIREKNALSPSVEFSEQFVGELVVKAKISNAHLLRIARSKEASNNEKIQAESVAWNIFSDLAQRLQSMGFLPTQPQTVIGEFFHNFNSDNLDDALKDISDQAIEIQELIPESNNDNASINTELGKVKNFVKEARIRSKQDKKEEKNEESS